MEERLEVPPQEQHQFSLEIQSLSVYTNQPEAIILFWVGAQLHRQAVRLMEHQGVQQ